jgi:hypothetical protein
MAMIQDEKTADGGQDVVSWPVLIDLQEGFVDDAVTVRIGEEQVFYKENVTTDLFEGRAESIEATVPEGPVTVEVSVASRHLSDKIVLNVPPVSHLGVSLSETQLRFRVSDESFLYF